MHTLALAVITDGASYAKRLAIAFENDPQLRLAEIHKIVHVQASIDNYTLADCSWTREDVQQATLDVAWYMATHRAELERDSKLAVK